jgi:hypothetical protein
MVEVNIGICGVAMQVRPGRLGRRWHWGLGVAAMMTMHRQSIEVGLDRFLFLQQLSETNSDRVKLFLVVLATSASANTILSSP